MVVELAVLDRPDVACSRSKGLMPMLDVDDAQPAYAERDTPLT